MNGEVLRDSSKFTRYLVGKNWSEKSFCPPFLVETMSSPPYFSRKKSPHPPNFFRKKIFTPFFLEKKSSSPCRLSGHGYSINFDPSLISSIGLTFLTVKILIGFLHPLFSRKKSSSPCRWSGPGYSINFDPSLISSIG